LAPEPVWTLGRKISLVCAMNLIFIPPHILAFPAPRELSFAGRVFRMVKFVFEHALPLTISNVHITSTDDTSRDVFPIV